MTYPNNIDGNLADVNITNSTPMDDADNTIVLVNKAELKEALKLAGIAMTTIWMQPYL